MKRFVEEINILPTLNRLKKYQHICKNKLKKIMSQKGTTHPSSIQDLRLLKFRTFKR